MYASQNFISKRESQQSYELDSQLSKEIKLHWKKILINFI